VDDALDVMRSLARDGMTMIVVTNEMQFAREAASRVVLLDHRRIVEEADADYCIVSNREREEMFFRRGRKHQPIARPLVHAVDAKSRTVAACLTKRRARGVTMPLGQVRHKLAMSPDRLAR
jgi:energy-coupling factor transporter ATP-binding protein EcfA2